MVDMGVVKKKLELKCSVACNSRLFHIELNDKRLMKRTFLRMQALPPARSGFKQAPRKV
jgi:hypothetical protein